VHVHLGAAHHTANVVLLDGDVLAPGQTGRVQLVLDAPVHAVPGDRFVIRNAQATATIGGGMVLDPFGPARKRRSAARTGVAGCAGRFIANGDIGALLARGPLGLRASMLVRLSQLPAADRAPAGTLEVALQGGDTLLIAPPKCRRCNTHPGGAGRLPRTRAGRCRAGTVAPEAHRLTGHGRPPVEPPDRHPAGQRRSTSAAAACTCQPTAWS
jgi:hypothetical protein